MDQISQNIFKKQLVQKISSDLASKNPDLVKRAESIKSQFLQDKQNSLLTGDSIDFGKYLTAYSNNSGPKSFVDQFNKPFATAMAPAAKKAPAPKKLLSYGDEEFVGPPTLANLKTNPNLDYLISGYDSNALKNSGYTARNLFPKESIAMAEKYHNNLELSGKAKQLKNTISSFYKKSVNGYTPELIEDFKNISNMSANLGYDNVSDIKMATNHFQKMIQKELLKKYNISPVDFIKKHQEYLKLSNEEKQKSDFRKILVDAGMMYSKGVPGTLMYTKETADIFSANFDRNKNFLTDPNNISQISSMNILGENILGGIYHDKQKFTLSQIEPLRLKMDDINNQIQTVQAKYNTQIEGLDNELKKINSTEPKTQEEYNLMSSRFSAIQNKIKSIQLQAKTETSGLYKQHRDIYKEYKPKVAELENDGDAFNKQLSLVLNPDDYSMKFKDAYTKEQVQNSFLNKAINFVAGNPLNPLNYTLGAEQGDAARIGINFYKWIQNDLYGATSNWALSKLDNNMGAYNASVEKLQVERQQYAWNTGELDGEGNPITTKTVTWKDAEGNTHINPTGAVEATVQTTAQMALAALVTKGLAAGTAGVANAAGNIGVKAFNGLYGTAKYSKYALTGADVLKTSIGGVNIGGRLMTYPAVYMTTYGKSLNEAVNNFDSFDKAKEHASAMTNFEAITESIVPDVFFFSNKLWSPKLAGKLSEKKLKEITGFLSTLKNVEGKAARKLFAQKVLATAGQQGLSTIQEALVEEEINLALQSSYESNKIKEEGIQNYVRQGEEFTAESAKDLGIESLVTMSASSLLGLKGAWQNVSQKMGFDANNPKYMNYHRMNVAANANQVRTSIANDNTINAEQKARAFQTISQYEELLKTAAMAVKKPNPKTLANDEDGIFAYFTALSDKMDIETKMLKGAISEEDTKKYEVTSKILESIDKENKDWSELDPQQKQDQWFKWYKEHTLNVDSQGLKNSSSNRIIKLRTKQEEVEKLYKDNHINDDMYAKYKQSFDETYKKIKGDSKKDIEGHLQNLDNLSLYELQTLERDINMTMALNNDAKVTSHLYNVDMLPDEGELSGRPQDFKNRIANAMREVDKVKVEYLDKDNNTKQATLVKRDGQLYIDGTDLQLDEVDEIQKATVGEAQLSANKDLETNKQFYESGIQKVKMAQVLEYAKFQDRFGKEVQAIEETSNKELATIVETTNSKGKTVFEYKTFDPKTNTQTVAYADTREEAQKQIELKKKMAISVLYSKRDEVLPKTDIAVEEKPVVEENPPVAGTETPVVGTETPAVVVTTPAVEVVETGVVEETKISTEDAIEKILNSKETDSVERRKNIDKYVESVKDLETTIDEIIEYKNENELSTVQTTIINSIIKKLVERRDNKKEEKVEEKPAETIDGLIAQIKKLRADEQAAYAAMTDPNDQAKRKEIYDKYDKLITPLLRKAKADIKARREETIALFMKGDVKTETEFVTVDKINAKYDAELEALKPDTEPAETNKIGAKTPSTISGYTSSPNQDGSIDKSSEKTNFVEGSSMLVLEPLGNNQFAVYIDTVHKSAKTLALQYKDKRIDPLFEGISAFNAKAESIQTVEPAIVELQGNKYVLVKKGKIDYDNVGINKENAKTIEQENLIEEDEQIPVEDDSSFMDIGFLFGEQGETNNEVVVDETVKPKYSDERVVTTPFSTVADERNKYEDKYVMSTDKYTIPIHKFLKSIGQGISNFKGKLMSMRKVIESQGVSVQEIKDKLAEYWALSEEDKIKNINEYSQFLDSKLGGMMPSSTIKWLLKDGVTTDALYGGEIAAKDKFEKITLSTFSLVITDQEGKIIKVDDNGKVSPNGTTLVSRALNKIVKDPDTGKYKFATIKSIDNAAFNAMIPVMYDIQTKFISGELEELEVENLGVTNGAYDSTSTKELPKGDLTLQIESDPAIRREAGRMYDEDGNMVYTGELSEADLDIVAAMLTTKGISKELYKEYNAYVNSIVFIKDEDKNRFRKMSVEDIKKELKSKHYNISDKLLGGAIQQYKLENGVLTPTAKMPYDKFMEDKWYTRKFDITPGINNKITFTPKAATEEEIIENAEDVDFVDVPWEYSKSNRKTRSTSEEEVKAYTWFLRSFLSKGISLNKEFVAHPSAFASFTNAAYTLYEGSTYVDLYHESWHRFSQNFLTIDEKENLYNAFKSMFEEGDVTDAELKVLEESLAEGSRSYALSGYKTMEVTFRGKTLKINMEKPTVKQKTFVEKIKSLFNMFKSMFTSKKDTRKSAEDVVADYMREAHAETTLRTSNPKNALFQEALNTSRQKEFTVTDSKGTHQVMIDYASMNELNQGIDYLFVSYFNNIPQYKEAGVKLSALATLPEKLRNEVAAKIYNKIKKDLKNIADQQTNDVKKREFQAIIDNFDKIIQEGSELRKAFVNSYKNVLDENLNELNEEESKINTAEVYETKIDQQGFASNAVLDAVKFVPKLNKDGSLYNGATWGLPELVPFANTWVILANNLQGMTYPEMHDKITAMANSTHPQFKYLLENLPERNLRPDAKLSTHQLKIDFEQVFNMPKIAEVIVQMSSNQANDFIVKVFEAGTSASKNIVESWKNEIVESLSLKELFEKYPTIDSLKSIDQVIKFLSDVGVAFSDENALMQEFENVNKLASFRQSAILIYKHLTEVSKSEDVVDNIISTIQNDRKDGKKGEGKQLSVLAKFEIDTNEAISDDMIYKANGTTDFKFKQFNYLTKLSFSMDRMPYEELAKNYPQFDLTKNPAIRNSNWFNHLFTIDANGKVTRTKANSLEFIRMGGLETDEINNKDGFVTIDLLASDKLVMDFYSFTQSGLEENSRNGDKTTAYGSKLNGVSPIAVTDTKTMLDNLQNLLLGELANLRHLENIQKEKKFTTNSKQNIHKAETFIFFKNMLSQELKDKLLKAGIELRNNKWQFKDETLTSEIHKELMDYFKAIAIDGMEGKPSFKTMLVRALGPNLDAVMPKIHTAETNKKEKYTTDEILMWYYMQSVANRIDQFNVMFGDARNFGNGSDVFKRLSAYTATGKFPVLNEDDLDRLNVKGRELESLFSNSKRSVTSEFNIVQFQDVPVNLSEEYMGKDLSDDLKKAWGDYIKESDGKNKGEKTDASGAVTLDFYRMLNKLIGTWTPAQEKAYDSQVAFVKAKIAYEKADGLAAAELLPAYEETLSKAKASYEDLLTVFNPKKWQYAGSIFSNHTLASKTDMRAFLKFSIMPLIPSNIVGSELEKVSENMYKTNTDLYVFSSGSKMTMDQENEKFSDWSKDKTPSFNPTVLDLKNFKEQLPIENKMKNEGVFASQMRKLMSVGIFENGEVVKGRNKEYYDRYSKAVSNITDLLSVDLASKLDTTKKIVEYLSKEFDKRDMPEHIKEFMQYYEKEGAVVDSLDLSFQSFFIQNALFSIINNKLIKQEYSGGQFVQVPNIGFRKANFKENAKYGQQDLLFYQTPQGENTISMQIKIAFSKKYEGLLNIKWGDEKIGTVERLNTLLRDKDFMEKHGKKVTLVGCRIPVQGFSTIESMQVVEFLDPIAGQVIIVPDGLTIKSGSDFDIDKMNIYEPHIDRDGELVNLGINETHNVIEERNKLVKENEEYKSLLDELKNQIKDIDKTDFEEWIAIDDAIREATEEDEIDLTVLATDNKKGTKFTGFDQLAAAKKDNSKLKKALADKKVWQEKGKTLGENRQELLDMINALKTNISANRRAIATMVSSEVNALIDSVSEMILDKDNAANLLTMNELDYMESVYQAMGIGSKKDSKMDISEVADPIVSNQVFGVNTDAKRMLGIAAKSNPLYALFMQVGMKLDTKIASMLPQNTTLEGVTSLSNLYTQPYSGNNSEKYSKFGNMLKMYIPKLLSEYISMSVDVANDNRIGDPSLNINKFTMPMLIWNTMKGTHLFDTLDILTDPMVIQFTNEYRKKNSISYKQYVNKTNSKKNARFLLSKNSFIRNTLRSIVPEELLVTEKGMFGPRILIEETVNNALQNGADGTVLYYQRNVLEFISMMLNANKLTELSSAVSWDTNTSNSFIEFAYTDRQLDKIEKDGFFNGIGINKLRYDSVIAGLNITDFVEDKFTDLFSIISKDAFIDNALELYSNTTGVPLKDFARDYTTDFLTYLYQNNAKVLKNGEEVSAYDLYINQERLLDKTNEDNIRNRFYNALAKVKNPAIKSNSFVSNLKFKTVTGSNFMAPSIKNSKLDIVSANTMHTDMLKLINGAYSTNPEVNTELSEAAKLLFEVTALYNGLIKTIGAFNSLIPTDNYTKTLKDVVANGITQKDYSDFNNKFFYNRKYKFFKYAAYSLDTLKAIDKNNRYNYFISNKNVVSSQDMEQTIPASASVKPENISSKGSEFAKQLTNVGNAVGVTYKGKEYINSEHAYQTWKSGEFNQAGYDLKGGKVRGGKIGDTFSIMTDIITEKLKQNPELVKGIIERGGLDYIKQSTHEVIGDKFWESSGQNKFIEALAQAYKNTFPNIELEVEDKNCKGQ